MTKTRHNHNQIGQTSGKVLKEPEEKKDSSGKNIKFQGTELSMLEDVPWQLVQQENSELTALSTEREDSQPKIIYPAKMSFKKQR